MPVLRARDCVGINKAQTIKGNWQKQAGFLVPYQCGEAVVSGKEQMPEPKCGRHILDIEEMPPGETVLEFLMADGIFV